MKILLITDFFPPSNTVASHRMYGFARYLPEFGIDVDIFTPRRSGNLAHDLSHINIIYSHDEHRVVNKYSTDHSIAKKILTHLGLRPIKQFFFTRLYSEGKKRLDDQFLSAYDAILGSHRPVSALSLAYFLHKKSNLPLVLDYRDLWFDDWTDPWKPIERGIISTLERRVMNAASLVTTVSKTLASQLADRYDKSSVVIYNGFFTEILDKGGPPRRDEATNSNLDICYCGSLYGGRRPIEVLFPALRKIPASSLHIAIFDDFDRTFVLSLADKYDVKERVHIYMNLSNNESLELQKRCQVLLLLNYPDWRTRGCLPVKLFEYMAANKFILGIGSREDEAATIIRDLRLGEYVENEEQVLYELNKMRRDTPKYNPGILSFSRKNQTAILAKYLKQL